jgi:hypothetical protein
VRTGLTTACLLAIGCGAKTGLLVPDAGPDAGGVQDASVPRDCVVVPFGVGDVTVDLRTEARLEVADVMMVVDATASMTEEIDAIRERLRDRIVPGIARAIPDVEFGLAVFADFPARGFGTKPDLAYRMILPVTGDLVAAQAAVDEIPDWNGEDHPESQVEALYQTATGEGLEGWIPPAPGCASGGDGYPCFRREAVPIVMLFTDAPFHNGPGGSNAYEGLDGPPHTWEEAVDALDALGARFIGLDSGGGLLPSGRSDMIDTARSIGSVTVDGTPLVFDIGDDGKGLDSDVVEAVETLADAVRFDVEAVAVDVPGDDLDAMDFVVSIAPLRAEPASGVETVTSTAFEGVEPGTHLFFLLNLHNDSVVPGPRPLLVPLRIVFRGDGRSPIGERIVDLLIPAKDGSGDCPPE